MAGRPLCRASASGDVVAGRAAGGWPSAVPLASAEVLVEARATAADRLLVGAAASPDSDAFRAAGGRSARAGVPIPLSTPAETLVSFCTVAVVAGDCPIRSIPRRKIGKRVDCRIGGMLGIPRAGKYICRERSYLWLSKRPIIAPMQGCIVAALGVLKAINTLTSSKKRIR